MLRGLQLAQPRQQAESHADRKAIEAPRKHALGWLCSAGSPSRLLLRVVVACHDSNHDSPIEKGATARSSQGQWREERSSRVDSRSPRGACSPLLPPAPGQTGTSKCPTLRPQPRRATAGSAFTRPRPATPTAQRTFSSRADAPARAPREGPCTSAAL